MSGDMRLGWGLWATMLLPCALAAGCGQKKSGHSSSGGGNETGTATVSTSTNCLALDETSTETSTAGGTDTDTTADAGTDTDTELGAEGSTSTGTSSGSTGCTPYPTGTGTSTTPGGWTPGVGIEGCAAEGKAWIAAVNGGPGQCGDPLAAFCCTEAEVLRQFPLISQALQDAFSAPVSATSPKGGPKTQGLILYQCSTSAAGVTTTHWGKFENNTMSYASVFTDPGTAPMGGASTGECPVVSSTDIGIPAGAVPGVGTGTGGAIPASIGPLLSTAQADVLAYLAGGSYRNATDWTHEASAGAVTDPHGLLRVHYSPALHASMAAFAGGHPVGSVAIGEMFQADGVTPSGFVILGKGSAGAGASSWFFYELKGGPTAADFTAAPSAYAMGNPVLCVGCHSASAKDFIKSSLP